MNFYGYPRSDGRAGVRNYVLVLPASMCASDTANSIAAQVQGAVSFHNQVGCSQVPSDMQYALDMMAGFAANPNVYGTVLVAIGCETCQCDMVAAEIRKRTDKPLESFIIRQEGGTLRTVEKAVRAARAMAAEASRLQKQPIPISQLLLATECGGSDPTSGIAANPVIGALSDRIVAQGGGVILSETTEFIGAEDILVKRAATPEVRQRILDIVGRYEEHFLRCGENVRLGNPTPGNIAGGLTTLEEKSLGCIHKGGHRPVEAVYEYSEIIDKKGLVIMDTPGNDPSSVAAMVAGGAQVVLFSTGRGTPTGNPVAPIIKLTANPQTYAGMSDNIDVDASMLLTEPERMSELADMLVAEVAATASGKLTKSEALGYTEMAIARVCNYV